MPEWPTPPVGRAVRFLPAAHQNGLKAALHGGGIRKLSALTGAGDWEITCVSSAFSIRDVLLPLAASGFVLISPSVSSKLLIVAMFGTIHLRIHSGEKILNAVGGIEFAVSHSQGESLRFLQRLIEVFRSLFHILQKLFDGCFIFCLEQDDKLIAGISGGDAVLRCGFRENLPYPPDRAISS